MLLDEGESACLAEVAGVNAVEIHAARRPPGIPIRSITSGCEVLIHEEGDEMSERVVDGDAHVSSRCHVKLDGG